MRSRCHQPAGSLCSGVSVLGDSTQLTSSPRVGVSVSAEQLRDMAQNTVEELKVLHFVERLKYHDLVLLDCFPFFLHFLISPMKFTL